MNIIYILLILLEAGVIVFFIRRGRLQAKKAAEKPAVPATDTYEGTRSLAINVTPLQLKLAIPASETLVYGVVMDWDTGEVVVTLSAYITGAANICFSTGGIKAGGGKNPEVGELAVDFVLAAQHYLGRAIPATTPMGLPSKDCVRFYLLTNKGIYAAQEQVKYFEDESSPWLILFVKGSNIINEIRSSGNEV
jgi:hypothetical protein